MLEDENFRAGVSANFAKNIRYSFDVDQDMERYYGIDFDKRRYWMFGNVNTSRILSFGTGFDWGDEVYFDGANAFLGRESGFRTFINSVTDLITPDARPAAARPGTPGPDPDGFRPAGRRRRVYSSGLRWTAGRSTRVVWSRTPGSTIQRRGAT